MSKKESKKNKKGGDSKKVEYEEIRKAVIIGGNFTNLLNPLNSDTPNLLLPLCGIPIIEFMLDSLSSSNIFKEIIICVKKHHDSELLEKYLKKYHKNLNIKIIENEDFNSVGDCLRKIYTEKLISTDFALIRGLVITNADIDELYKIHQQNKAKDKNCLVTSIMKKYKNTNEIKTNYDENILIYDDNTKKIYQFEPTIEENKDIKIYETINNKKTNINNNYIVRNDLLETGIEMCGAEFLNVLNENFEIQNTRDLIKHMLVNNEIYLDTFYIHDLGKDVYCGMIRNIESYLKVNFEIVNRWAYPIVIDNVDMSNKLKINLKQIKFSIYSDKDTNSENYHKANLISEIVILDKENTVGKDSRLQRCILCKDVKVGKNCDLYNCIIFKGTEIEDGVEIKNSIIGNNCIIKKNIKIISSVLGSNIKQETDAIQKRIYYESNDEGKQSLEIIDRESFLQKLSKNDSLFVSNNSTVYRFNDENLLNDLNQKKGNTNNDNKNKINIKTFNYDSDEFIEEETISSDISESDENNQGEEYSNEINNILSPGIDNKSNIEDIIKELASLKNSYFNNTYEETMKQCLSIIITKFLNGEKFNKSHIPKIIKLFKDWKNLFKRFVTNEEVELHLISVIEQLCIEIEEINSAFHILIQVLNSQCEVIGDDAVLKWYKSNESYYAELEGKVFIPPDVNQENKNKLKKYIELNLLNNDGDEEEEEEEDDDDK
jgi:translation initiation factor eIF-2B subunit epsilon